MCSTLLFPLLCQTAPCIPLRLCACCCCGGLRGRRMLRAAVTLQEFAAGRTPVRSRPCKQALPVPCPLLRSGRCHPQCFTAPPALTKLRPKASCVPAAPALCGHQGFVGSAVGAPAGAWWPPTWSGFAWERSGVAAHPLAMCSAWQTSCWWPGIPAPLPSPCFLSSLKAFLGNRRLEITLLSDVLLKEPFAAWWRGSVLAERACTQRCFSGDLGARRPHATVAA